MSDDAFRKLILGVLLWAAIVILGVLLGAISAKGQEPVTIVEVK